MLWALTITKRKGWSLALPLLVAAPVCAEVMSDRRDPRMAVAPGEDPCFAVIKIENRFGLYNQTETLATSEGPVSVAYTTVGGHNADDHDKVAVVDLPSHVMAAPPELDIPDGDTGSICLMKWIGG